MGLIAAVSVMGNLDIWIVAPEGWKSISLHIRVRFGQFKEFLCYKITLGFGGWDRRHNVGSGKIIADIKQRAIEHSGKLLSQRRDVKLADILQQFDQSIYRMVNQSFAFFS